VSPNLRAFLGMLAVSEGTETSKATKDHGYDVIVTGADGVPEIMTSYGTHPFAGGRQPKLVSAKTGLRSTASGRYQFLVRDWGFYRLKLNLPDFGPEAQDRWAVQLIKERRALDDIETGHFVRAVGKVSNLWASLPGAGYGQPEHHMEALAEIYERAGGAFT
jgi:muramidase (phage lysozyme)